MSELVAVANVTLLSTVGILTKDCNTDRNAPYIAIMLSVSRGALRWTWPLDPELQRELSRKA